MAIRYSSVVGGSSGTGFNLDIGASGNTTFEFATANPAGGYSITSQLADTTIEFYAIAEDGSLAGYTNTKALTATKDFNKMVVYGATNNDLITFEYKPTTLPTASGDLNSGAAPYITSISDADLANIDDTTIITGGNFATDVSVTFTGTDAVVRIPKSIVRTNSSQLIVARTDDMIEDYAPYEIEVSNPGIPQSAYKTYTSSITVGGDPIWNTTNLPNVEGSAPYSTFLDATDPDGSSITYSIVSGSLPTGLALNGQTGEISGTATVPSEFPASIIFSAEDASGNITNKSLSIDITSLITSGLNFYIDGYISASYPGTGTTVYDLAGSNNMTLVGGFDATTKSFVFTDNSSHRLYNSSFTGFYNLSSASGTLWVNRAASNGSGSIYGLMSYAVPSYDNYVLYALGEPSTDQLLWGPAGSTQATSLSNSAPIGSWTNLTWTKQAGQFVKMYKNGVLVYTNNTSDDVSITTNNGYFAIGQEQDTVGGGFDTTQDFPGKVAMAAIYNRALTDQEVLDNYNNTKSRFGL